MVGIGEALEWLVGAPRAHARAKTEPALMSITSALRFISSSSSKTSCAIGDAAAIALCSLDGPLFPT